MNELKLLWGKLLGQIPSDAQFDFWTAMHSREVIEHSILKTTQKNLSVNGTMSQDYKVRFASKVMLTQSERNTSNALNRQRLSEEFEGQVQR
jgi:hypothetical protein